MPSKTKKQKKFFGAVMGAKKGQKGVKGSAKKTAKKMTKKQIKKYLKKESFNDVYRNLVEQTEGLADWEIGVEESPEYAEGEARQGYEESGDKLETIKQKAISDLLSKGWSETDRQILKLKAAADLEDVWYALYYVAEYIGKRKGWGEEGISELHNELTDAYWEGEVPEF